MIFEVYSVGESTFLEQIFISVAMISGSGSMAKLAMIGGLLGVIFVIVQSIFHGGQAINFQHIFLGWILYLCMFGPKVTTVIVDAYSGNDRVVDNVPISIGVAGGIISKLGYGLSEMYEQGFAAIEPNVNRRRYMESLEILTELHRNGNDSSIFTTLNNAIGSGADLRRSWDNYIRECTVTKIDLGETTIDTMMRQPIYDALQFDSKIYGTQIFLPNAENDTCSGAFTTLKQATQRIKDDPLVVEQINRVLGYNPADAASSLAGDPPLIRAQRALSSLQANATNAYDFMQLSILEPLYMSAVTGRYQDVHDNTAAIMVNQALTQRNVQWAAEHSQFMTAARPLMAFIEGFVYAIVPVMAFLIMLGGMGLGLAVKYVIMILWIQLWMPTLAVTNLYLHNAVSSDMVAKLNVQSDAIDSMYALNSAADILSHWIGTGGMLAAATPVLSLVFVTGSAYALTSLAQRTSGGDHVNEKMVAPDVMSNGPVAQFAPAYQGDIMRGLQSTGSQSTMSSVSLGSSVDSAITSASTNQHNASEQFQEQFGKQWSETWQHGNGYQAASSLNDAVRSTGSDAYKALQSHVQEYANSNNLTSSQKEALTGAVAGELIAGGGKGVGGAIKGGVNSQSLSDIGVSQGDMAKLADSAGLSKEQVATLTRDTARSLQNTGTESWGLTGTDADTGALSQSANEVLSTSETYAKLAAAKSSAGTGLNTDMFTLGSMVSGNPAASQMLNEAWAAAPADVKAEARSLEELYKAPASMGGAGLSPENAKNAARLTSLANPSNYTQGGNYADGVSSMVSVAGAATGRNTGVDTGFGRNQDLDSVGGGIRERVEGAVSTGGPVIGRGDVGAMAGMSAPDSNIVGMHSDRVGGVIGSGEDFRNNAAFDSMNHARDTIMNGNMTTMSSADTLFGSSGKIMDAYSTYFQNSGSMSDAEMQAQLYDRYENIGFNAGLTSAQAALYGGVGSYDRDQVEVAREAVAAEIRNNNPDLTGPQQDKLYQQISSRIENSAYRSGAAGQSGLVDIARLNQTQEKLLPQRQTNLFQQ